MDLLCVMEHSMVEGVDVINNGILWRDFIPNTLLQICVSQLINPFDTSILNYPNYFHWEREEGESKSNVNLPVEVLQSMNCETYLLSQ